MTDSAKEGDDSTGSTPLTPAGWRLELMGRLAGALIGLVPGLLLWVVGIPLTDGNDLLTFAFYGAALAFVGFIVGYLWGAKATSWLRDHVVVSLFAGLVAVLLLVGVLFAFGG